jgi:hypothetical protein
MSVHPRDERLETVLDDFAMAFDDAPDHADLRVWLDRYPEYRDALIALAARWSVSAVLVPRPDALPADPAWAVRGQEVVARVLANLAPGESITSLLAQAQGINRTAQDAAAHAGLSVPLFAQLDRRLIRFESLPDILFTRLAAAIGRTVADVRAYLARPPMLPQGAQFRADTAPIAAEATQDFFAAVRADPLLTEAEKAQWLALAPTTNGSA